MADTMRWRYGETNPVVMTVNSESVIEIGDLVYVDSNEIWPAAHQADNEAEADNQEAFHDAFVGVAMQRSRAGDTTPIRIATSGVFEFPAAESEYEVGTLLGVDEASNGTELENQVVAEVPTANRAIGRCAKRVSPAAATVLVDIVSTVCKGGPQTAA